MAWLTAWLMRWTDVHAPLEGGTVSDVFTDAHRWLTLTAVLAVLTGHTGCKKACESESPAFELELRLASGLSPAKVDAVQLSVEVGSRTETATFEASTLRSRGHATVAVQVGPAGDDGFKARVWAAAVDKGGAVLATTTQTFDGSGNACNFFSMVLGANVDGGSFETTIPEATPGDQGCPTLCAGKCVDLQTDNANCGACGTTCSAAEPCQTGLCTVSISGSLSGLLNHPGKRVVVSGNVTVTAYNGSDDVTSCDAGETGCLRIVARQILVSSGTTIDAAGAGFGGGGGGGGAVGHTGGGTTCKSSTSGSGGAGVRGGASGQAGTYDATSTTGGAGGKGGGPFGGAGGAAVTMANSDGPKTGGAGQAGGYGAPGKNADTTTDSALWLGSGGGGGSGGAHAMESMYSSVGGSGGGGAGNAGGGAIILSATESIVVAGTLKADGLAAAAGNGGNGTDGKYQTIHCDLSGSGGAGGAAGGSGASSGGKGEWGYFTAGWDDCVERQCENNGSKSLQGASGGAGGAGSGGGILLQGATITVSGTIQTLGGGGTTNGGTVKLLYTTGPKPTGTIMAGRIYP